MKDSQNNVELDGILQTIEKAVKDARQANLNVLRMAAGRVALGTPQGNAEALRTAIIRIRETASDLEEFTFQHRI